MSNTSLPIRGDFVPASVAFAGTSGGLDKVLKFEVVPKIIRRRTPGGGKQDVFDIEVVNNRMIIDFTELDPSTLDLCKLLQDCEILQRSLKGNWSEIEHA
ncbi:hypothetical protein LTR95_012041 [Oleoguttula sp. CCFEE 5521]